MLRAHPTRLSPDPGGLPPPRLARQQRALHRDKSPLLTGTCATTAPPPGMAVTLPAAIRRERQETLRTRLSTGPSGNPLPGTAG
ncbi:MAG: hypothetical protein JOZ57_17765 [Abitibacteriaceae bacterium]|nr:hypothetical protein [Abditibacteriaceae bacterium]